MLGASLPTRLELPVGPGTGFNTPPDASPDKPTGPWHYLGPIPRHPGSSPEAARLVAAGQPVILTGTRLVATAAGKWTLDYLEKHISDRHRVGVNRTKLPSARFRYSDPDNNPGGWKYVSHVHKSECSFQEFAQALRLRMKAHEVLLGKGGSGATGNAVEQQRHAEAAVRAAAGAKRHRSAGVAHSSQAASASAARRRNEAAAGSTESKQQKGSGASSSSSSSSGDATAAAPTVAPGGAGGGAGASDSSDDGSAAGAGGDDGGDDEAVSKPAEVTAGASTAATAASTTNGTAAADAGKDGDAAGDDAASKADEIEAALALDWIYLQQTMYKGMGAQILKDFITFDWDFVTKMAKTNKWGELTTNMMLIGERGVVTPLHYDEQQNFFTQIQGRKRCILAPPSHFGCFYPFPVGHPADRQSQVDIRNPDIQRFPNLVRASFMEGVVAPGDVLYIPMYWWHQIESPWEMTTSITFWFKAGFAPMPTIPITDETVLVSMRRNIEKLVGDTAGFPASARLFRAIAEGADLTKEQAALKAQVILVMSKVLMPAQVMPFLLELADRRFSKDALGDPEAV